MGETWWIWVGLASNVGTALLTWHAERRARRWARIADDAAGVALDAMKLATDAARVCVEREKKSVAQEAQHG
jgi:hypothetical protein